MTAKAHNPRGYAFKFFEGGYNKMKRWRWFQLYYNDQGRPSKREHITTALALWDRMYDDDTDVVALATTIQKYLSSSYEADSRGLVRRRNNLWDYHYALTLDTPTAGSGGEGDEGGAPVLDLYYGSEDPNIVAVVEDDALIDNLALLGKVLRTDDHQALVDFMLDGDENGHRSTSQHSGLSAYLRESKGMTVRQANRAVARIRNASAKLEYDYDTSMLVLDE